MKAERPDPGVLDDLVAGLDEGEEADTAWRWVVGDPDGTDTWHKAARRRESLDRLATAVLGRPVLARSLCLVRRIRGALSGRVAFGIDVAMPSPAAATLGPTNDEADMLAMLTWGGVETMRVRIDHTVRFTPREPGEVTLFYEYAKGAGRFAGRWKMEPGDAPVLIVACRSGGAFERMQDALLRASDAVAVVLLEDAAADAGGDRSDDG